MVRVAIPLALVAAVVLIYVSRASTSNGQPTDAPLSSDAQRTVPGTRTERTPTRRVRPTLEPAKPGAYHIAHAAPRPGESEATHAERLDTIAALERFFTTADLTEDQRAWVLEHLGRAQDGYLRALAELSEDAEDADLAALLGKNPLDANIGRKMNDVRTWFDTYLRVQLAEGLSERQVNRFRLHWDSIHFFARSRPLERSN